MTKKEKDTPLDVNNLVKSKSKKSISEKLAEFIRATFFIPDARRGWLKYAVREGKKIIAEEKPDIIFSSSPPYTCALIAMELKKYSEKSGKKIPWVSDFRDAWTGYPSTPKRWFIPSIIDKSYEKKTLANADVITIVAEGITEDFSQKYPSISNNKKYVLIRNGYDIDDYFHVKYEKKKNEKFTLVYTGSLYGTNLIFLIDTVSELVNEGKINKNKIKFILIGRLEGKLVNYINSSQLKDVIELIPYVPHSESVNYLMKADVMLLLIEEDRFSDMRISGKLFEYLGAGAITQKPILAIAGKEAADLIKEASAGETIPYRDKEKLRAVFLKFYNSIFENNNSIPVNTEVIKQYERRLLTKKLADVFNLSKEK